MDSRVYYGEYSLMHWIQMLLSKNVLLPDYQRSFVWEEKDIRRLLKSIEEGQFVQPVTIALYKTGNNQFGQNLIIDGQQRLSSVLLAFLGYMPIKSRFEKPEAFASDEDDASDEALGTEDKGPIEWRFSELLKDNGDNTVEGIKRRLIEDKRYSALSISLPDRFFEKHFLGYSYIVPVSADSATVQKGFSQLFRDINFFGKKLSALESRRSLYYLNEELFSFFEGVIDEDDVLCGIRLSDKMQPIKIDFVRYLSIISQFKISHNPERVLVGYSASSSRENYYADYVSYLLGLEQEDREHKFDTFSFETTFPGMCWKDRYGRLKESLERLKPMLRLNSNDAFVSWIDADYWLFGLIYHIVFEGKALKDDLSDLASTMVSEIGSKKKSEYYSKAPNRLGNLRERLGQSISILGAYVQ